jgi:hypothetical protein
MSLQTFLFKRIDQLFIFMFITLFFILIMYFKITEDEVNINEHINSAFINICNVDNIDQKFTMGKFRSMFCDTEIEESLFSKIVLTFKLLYTSSYIYNINILNFISSILNNTSNNSPSSHKLLLLILYTVVYLLYIATMHINNFFVKLVNFKNNKPKKKTPFSLGRSIVNALKSRLISFIFFIITISIIINFFTYISDIMMGMCQASKIQFVFFIMFIILLPIILTTGIFNLKIEKPKNDVICKNNNKFLILLFVLIIPIITGIRQFTTIISRGLANMYNEPSKKAVNVLFKTIFIMVLVLFNFDLLMNLGTKNQKIFI